MCGELKKICGALYIYFKQAVWSVVQTSGSKVRKPELSPRITNF